MSLTDPEIQRLRAFRCVAREVREATIIAQGQRIELHVAQDGPDHMAIYVSLLGREPFRSLALAVRLAYQQGEPAHFYSVCNILRQNGQGDIVSLVDSIRSQFRETLSDPSGRVAVDSENGTSVFSATEVFEHWLYGIAFHQNLQRQSAVAQLKTVEPRFLWSVQATSLQLAGRILDLDDVIADFLDEAQLERI
jgi:hypothetical protein